MLGNVSDHASSLLYLSEKTIEIEESRQENLFFDDIYKTINSRKIYSAYVIKCRGYNQGDRTRSQRDK